MQADYVIVGAGSAGCVLANRLTEDPASRVILIEAGGRDWNPLIHIPVGYMKLLDHKQLTWGFKAEADPGTNGRAIAYPRGRVLGGSCSTHGPVYIGTPPAGGKTGKSSSRHQIAGASAGVRRHARCGGRILSPVRRRARRRGARG